MPPVRTPKRRPLQAFLLSVAVAGIGEPAGAGGTDLRAEQVLARALDNFNPNVHQRVRFINYDGEEKGFTREMEVWVKRFDGVAHVLGEFASPPSIRGTAFLARQPADAAASGGTLPSYDYYIYLPALGRVRHVSGAQRGDAFFSTQLSQGDMEIHPVGHYQVLSMKDAQRDGERVHRIEVEPRFETGYDRAAIEVAKEDFAVLRVEQYSTGSSRPVRIIEARRAWQEPVGSHVLPSKLVARNGTGTHSTEVLFLERKLDPKLPRRMFSIGFLERRGR